MKQIKNPALVLGLLAAGITLFIYLTTAAPGVYWEDSGELISAVACLGIAHTPGHPLYVLLGKTFSFGVIDPALILNLFSVWCAGLTIFLLYQTGRAALTEFSLLPEYWRQSLVLAGCGLVLAFSPTFWSQALIAEVYSLQALLTVLIMLALFQWDNSAHDPRWLLMTAFLCAIGLTNNVTLVVILPAVILFIIVCGGFGIVKSPVSWLTLPFFLFGLSVYLYLPVRSALDPAVDWGNPETLTQFGWMIGMKEYAAGVGSTYAVDSRYGLLFIEKIIAEFTVFGLIGIVFGMVVVFIRQWKTGLFLTVVVILNVIFSLQTGSGPDFDSYFITSYLCLTLFLAFGLIYIVQLKPRAIPWQRMTHAGPLLFVILLSGWQIYQHYPVVNRNRVTFPAEHIHILDRHLPPDAVYITDNTVDHFLLMYHQVVGQKRLDVANVYLPLLRFEWYQRQVLAHNPKLLIPTYPPISELSDSRILQDFIRVNQNQHELYYSTARSFLIPPEMLQPYGYLFKISPDSLDVARHLSLMEELKPVLPDYADAKTRMHYAIHHSQLGQLLWARHDRPNAIAEMYTATRMDPTNSEAYFNLAAALESVARYDEAISAYEKALDLNPNSSIALFRVGVAFHNMRLNKSAIAYFEQALKLKPQNADYWYHLAVVQMDEKMIQEALNSVEKALAFRPDFADAYYIQGLLLRRREKLSESISAFKKVTELNPAFRDGWLELGSNLLRLNKYDEALSVFLKAVDLDPENPYAWFTIARVQAKRLKPEEVQKALDKAIELGGNEIKFMAKTDPILEPFIE